MPDAAVQQTSYFQNDRHELLPLFPSGIRKILEVGCGDGLLGRSLRQNGMEVWGIERDPEAAERAKQHLDQVFCADLEHWDPPFEPAFFDCLIFADILEHLRDPWSLLREYRRTLKPGGYVVSSIPNIRYYRTLRDLAFRGRWEYAESGILDRTHLRFFTLASIRSMFEQSGFRILKIERNIVAPKEKLLLNQLLRGLLNDLLTFQYFLLAQTSRSETV